MFFEAQAKREEAAAEKDGTEEDVSIGKYGSYGLMQSQEARPAIQFVKVREISKQDHVKTVLF